VGGKTVKRARRRTSRKRELDREKRQKKADDERRGS